MEQGLGTSLLSLILSGDTLSISNSATFFSFLLLRIVCSYLHCSAVLLSKYFKVEYVIVYTWECKENAWSERIKIHHLYATGSMNEKT